MGSFPIEISTRRSFSNFLSDSKVNGKMAKKKIAKKGAKKAPAKKKAQAKKKAKPAPRPSSDGQVVQLICSECEEPLKFDSGSADDTLTCPECLLVVKKPDEDFLSIVGMHLGSEKKFLLLTVVMLVLFFISIGGLIYYTSPVHDKIDENMKNIFMGASGLFFLISMICLFKYEKSRWQVYF